jgi:hypothetical protein
MNLSNNSVREEGIYGMADLCLNMTKLTKLRLYFRK